MKASLRFIITTFLAAFSCGGLAADGGNIFLQQCAACHGRSGEGMRYVAPPLKGSEFVKSASVEEIKQVVRAGRSGTEKKHPAFPSVMPPFPNLQDDEINALAEYLKGPLQQ